MIYFYTYKELKNYFLLFGYSVTQYPRFTCITNKENGYEMTFPNADEAVAAKMTL